MRKFCQAYKLGIQSELPARTTKTEKPKREGKVYWLVNEAGEVLLERRGDKRMLGGMLALPTTSWDKRGRDPDIKCKLQHITDVYHSFTHFDLKLEVWAGQVKSNDFLSGLWYKEEDVMNVGLPSVFLKAAKVFTKVFK